MPHWAVELTTCYISLRFKWSFRFPSCLELADNMLYDQFSMSFKFGPYKITDTG